jgi:hypothetical protein
MCHLELMAVGNIDQVFEYLLKCVLLVERRANRVE